MPTGASVMSCSMPKSNSSCLVWRAKNACSMACIWAADQGVCTVGSLSDRSNASQSASLAEASMIPSATIQSSKPKITRDIGRAMMWPSRHAWTISTPIMREPSRSKSKPCTRSAPIACSMVQVITHWAETSTNCASPVRSIRAWATKAHAAASAPVCRQTCGTLIRTGARSRGPCSDMGPPRAANTRSLATSPARGPSLPKGEICTCTMRGLSSRTSAGVTPNASNMLGADDSNRKSAEAISALSTSRSAAAPSTSSTMERLLRLKARNERLARPSAPPVPS